jgi:hypothetical protein
MLEPTVADVLREAIESSDEELLVVNPNGATLEELVDVLGEGEGPLVRVLADERTLKDLMEDFIVASNAADLVAADSLAFRTYDGTDNTLVVTPSSTVAIVEAGGTVAGLVTDDEAFIDDAYGAYDAAWDDAEEFPLQTPPMSEARETLDEDISPEAAEDFDGVLASLETARGDGDGLDKVTISLLVAAKNEELLYDISKWGEDVGIASKATFSRTKTDLEDLGLLDTEKVPIDVGRPRLRLKLGHEELRDTSADDLASAAQSLMT